MLLILDYHNSAYNGFGSPSTPAGVAAYSRFAAAAAKHYHGRDVIWEIYNEPLNFWAAPTGQRLNLRSQNGSLLNWPHGMGPRDEPSQALHPMAQPFENPGSAARR